MSKARIFIFTVLVSILFCMSGCGEEEDTSKRKDNRESEEIEEVIETEAPELTAEPTEVPTAEPTPVPTEEPTPEPTPEVTPAPTQSPVVVTEFVDTEDILTDMEAVFAAALDYIVPEEEADAAAQVSNAIIRKTSIQIQDVSNTNCSVTIRYPDAAEAIRIAEAALPAEATEAEIEAMLLALAQAIEAEEVTMIEESFEAVIVEADGMRTIQWTPELYDAVTGGLYTAE